MSSKSRQILSLGFAPILVLLIVVALGVVGFVSYKYGINKISGPINVIPAGLSSPTPTAKPINDPTLDWETYANKEWIFSFKYPKEAKLSSEQKPSVSITYIGPKQVASGRTQTELFDGYKVNFSAAKIAPGGSLEYSAGYLHDHTLQSCPDPVKAAISPLLNLKIAGVDAKSFDVSNCFGDFTITMLNNNGDEYTITQIYVADNNTELAKYKEITNQILSTFKFNDQGNEYKTYYSPNLDVTVKYPKDWKLETGTYIGDATFTDPEACDYISKFFVGYLKDQNSCNNLTIKNFTPGTTFISPDRKNKLQFAGPTSGLGGACPECIDNTKTFFTVSGRSYSINTVQMPQGAYYQTLIGPDRVGILAGPKSVWNKFDIYLTAQSKEIFDQEIKILESIK